MPCGCPTAVGQPYIPGGKATIVPQKPLRSAAFFVCSTHHNALLEYRRYPAPSGRTFLIFVCCPSEAVSIRSWRRVAADVSFPSALRTSIRGRQDLLDPRTRAMAPNCRATRTSSILRLILSSDGLAQSVPYQSATVAIRFEEIRRQQYSRCPGGAESHHS